MTSKIKDGTRNISLFQQPMLKPKMVETQSLHIGYWLVVQMRNLFPYTINNLKSGRVKAIPIHHAANCSNVSKYRSMPTSSCWGTWAGNNPLYWYPGLTWTYCPWTTIKQRKTTIRNGSWFMVNWLTYCLVATFTCLFLALQILSNTYVECLGINFGPIFFNAL